jgi:hypothetical protein
VAGAVYLPWIAFTTWYYGSPIPNTILAKAAGYPNYWENPEGFRDACGYVYEFLRAGVFRSLGPSFAGNSSGYAVLWDQRQLIMKAVAILVLFGGWHAIRRRQFAWWPLYAFAFAVTCYFVFFVPFVFGWYPVPLTAVVSILAAKGLMDLTDLISPQRRAVAGGLVAVAYVSVLALALPTTFAAEKHIQESVENPVRRALGTYLDQVMAPNEICGGESLGYFSYYSRRAYYDYPGLASRKIRLWLQADRSHRNLLRMLAHFRPDYIVLRPVEYKRAPDADQAFLKDYQFIRVYKVDQVHRSMLLFPRLNYDTEYHLFKKIR